MNILTFLISLRPAMPRSIERPPAELTNSELRRLLQNRAVLINGETDWKWDDEVPPWIWQLVYFPKSATKRATIVQYNF